MGQSDRPRERQGGLDLWRSPCRGGEQASPHQARVTQFEFRAGFGIVLEQSRALAYARLAPTCLARRAPKLSGSSGDPTLLKLPSQCYIALHQVRFRVALA